MRAYGMGSAVAACPCCSEQWEKGNSWEGGGGIEVFRKLFKEVRK